MRFRDVRVENLPINMLDHESIVLHFDKKKMVEIKAKPFKCEEFWFHIPGFIDVVRDQMGPKIKINLDPIR